jgi:hypothetical protein
MTKSLLTQHNEWLISKQNQYAKNINELYRDGIEYSYYPVIPEKDKVPWFDKVKGAKIQ